ncbi:MAG: hypothetical protein ACREDR_22240 [Blastocatellia bacterium]
MTLAEYVRKVIKEKGLSLAEIVRRSNGAISDSYIQDITSGKTKRPSAKKLKGLATGIAEDYNYLTALASGQPQTEGWTASSLKNAIVKMVENEKIGEAVRALIEKSPDDVEKALRYLKRS